MIAKEDKAPIVSSHSRCLCIGVTSDLWACATKIALIEKMNPGWEDLPLSEASRSLISGSQHLLLARRDLRRASSPLTGELGGHIYTRARRRGQHGTERALRVFRDRFHQSIIFREVDARPLHRRADVPERHRRSARPPIASRAGSSPTPSTWSSSRSFRSATRKSSRSRRRRCAPSPCCIIVAGDASKVYFVGSLVQFITEGEIGKAMEEHRKSRDIESITDHAIICGYGRIGQVLARELEAKEFPVPHPRQQRRAGRPGPHARLPGADGRRRARRARCPRRTSSGRVVFATVLPNDMVNVFITLTARNMRPDLRIIARAEDPATEKKLKQAGANEIILPAFVGGMQIANSITHPSLDSILKDGSRAPQ